MQFLKKIFFIIEYVKKFYAEDFLLKKYSHPNNPKADFIQSGSPLLWSSSEEPNAWGTKLLSVRPINGSNGGKASRISWEKGHNILS